MLNDYLRENLINVQALNVEGFRQWLAARIASAMKDPVFQQQERIRDLRVQYRTKLKYRERTLKHALAAYKDCTNYTAIKTLERRVNGLHKAVAGLQQAVARQVADPEKLAAYREQLAQHEQALQTLIAQTQEWQQLDRIQERLRLFYEHIGLAQEQQALKALQQQRGVNYRSSGSHFEAQAFAMVQQQLMPELSRRSTMPLRQLANVTLGCARGEFDQIIVSVPTTPDLPVQVVAMIETKRNINDIGHGFRLRQENIAWFLGDDTGYKAASYRTAHYPEGAFNRPAIHYDGQMRYLFDRTSFADFSRDPQSGSYLCRLYFITQPRPLIGVTSAELARTLYRIIHDPGFNIASNAILYQYRKWVHSIMDECQAYQVLSMYAQDDILSQHIIFL